MSLSTPTVTTTAPTRSTHPGHVPRSPRCVLDSAESKALLAKHAIRLTEGQVAIFRDIETRWDVDVFNPDTAGCLVNGRFNQIAVDGYFVTIEKVWQVGPTASLEHIVQTLAKLFQQGLAFVLYAAAKCMVFSDALAHEAYRQRMLSKIDKRRRTPRTAIREYWCRIEVARVLLERAGESAATC